MMAGDVLGTAGRSGLRKADAAHGDDTTFTRWVREGRKVAPRVASPVDPRRFNAYSAAIREGRTTFRGMIQPVEGDRNLLVSGHNNVKIGRDVRKGRMFRGYWIYTLSLEERATCPLTCQHWIDCYGNNMPLAKRVDHRDLIALFERLEIEIDRLLPVAPKRRGRRVQRRVREGVLLRLHALGDFFSPAYVDFWALMLARHDRLGIFGYTAHRKGTPIGDAIERVRLAYPDRFRIRWSDGGEALDCTVSIGGTDDCPPDAFVCPEQTGRVDACAKCGAQGCYRRAPIYPSTRDMTGFDPSAFLDPSQSVATSGDTFAAPEIDVKPAENKDIWQPDPQSVATVAMICELTGDKPHALDLNRVFCQPESGRYVGEAWRRFCLGVCAFTDRYGAECLAAGWSPREIWGIGVSALVDTGDPIVHPRGLLNLGVAGAALMIGKREVIEIRADGIQFIADRLGALQTYWRDHNPINTNPKRFGLLWEVPIS